MTDQEMIEFSRRKAINLRGMHHDGLADTFDEIADRLEQLTTPAEKSPLTPQREAAIRSLPAPWPDTRDLLTALDHARAVIVHREGVIQDQCQESALYEAGVRAGVAKTLKEVNDLASDYSQEGNAQYTNLLQDCARWIGESCGHGELPPHAQTHVRMRRLEAALAEIATMHGLGDGGMPRAGQIALEALEEA